MRVKDVEMGDWGGGGEEEEWGGGAEGTEVGGSTLLTRNK